MKKALSFRILLPIIVSFILILFFLLISNYFSGVGTKDKSTNDSSDVSGIKEYWTVEINRLGAERAYQLFKEKNNSVALAQQHANAHIFGDLLYKNKGTSGIAICDSTFSFGCYHSFFGSAILDKGVGIVVDLNSACVEKFGPLGTGCPHGIGHGILEFMGHQKILKALDECSKIQQLKLLGCSSGVFMEHNFPTLTDGTVRTSVRNLAEDDPYAPCEQVTDKFQQSCYFELTALWNNAYKRDYEKMGKLCVSISSLSNRETCYIGIGDEIASHNNYDVEASIKYCQEMPDARSRLLCRSGASWALFAMPQFRESSPKLCTDLDIASQKFCLEKSDLTQEKI